MSKNHAVSSLKFPTGLGLGCLLLALALPAVAAPLTPGTPILLPGTRDKFDFIRTDTVNNRLLLGHEGNATLDVFDLAAGKMLKAVPTGTAQDATYDAKSGSYYVSGNDPGRMVIVDAASLAVTGEVPMPTNTDLIAFNPLTGLVYECNDTAAQVWVVDPAAKKIVTTIQLDGTGVEDLAFDPGHQHLYQAVKGKNTLTQIDPASNQTQAAWPCAPDKGVHGIAIVPEYNGVLVACAKNVVLFDRTTGQVVARAPIGGRVDEMAYDAGRHIAYCASRQGKISVIAVGAGTLTPLGDVPDETGTGSITVDPATHLVWIAYHQGEQCFVQSFTPNP